MEKINNLINSIAPQLSELFLFIVSMVLLFTALLISYLIANRLLSKYETHAKLFYLQKARKYLKVPILLLIIILSIWIPFTIFNTPPRLTLIVNKILTLLMIAIISWILIRAVAISKALILRRYDIGQKNNLKARKVYTQFKIIERVLNFIIILIAISLSLMTFEEIRKIGVSLIASAGVAGIILGFAAQKVIGGILAGVQIAITQPIRLDDVVIVENEWGKIEEINLTYVVVSIWDQRRLVLPTTYFIEQPFQNWTRNTSEILGTIYIHADYRLPVDAIREEQSRLLKATALWDQRVDVVQVTGAGELTMELRSLVSASDAGTAWDLRVYIREGLIRFIQEKYPECLPHSRIILENKP